ncbi:hypothetical protein [Gluconobacter sp. GP1]|uniref:hypothetical protein n=1 Tax=Gluconobacter sp. GP1 TaxID=3046423 RepID=UPI00293F69AD|nr:hypothetical protein [Gluconobacter sp. GP1]
MTSYSAHATWSPTVVTTVRYTGLPDRDAPAATPPRRVGRFSFIAGGMLFLVTNATDGFCALDQVAGPQSWHLHALGQPLFAPTFWPWMLLACVTLALVKVAERLTGLVSASGDRSRRGIRIVVTSVALLLGGLGRCLLHPA